MSPSDLLLAILVTAIWGLNFSIIKIGLISFDPYLLAAIRFALCAFPAMLFIPRPKMPLRMLIGYGVLFGVLQWGLVYAGIKAGLSAGLASLVFQFSVFFTMACGALFFHEKVAVHQALGAVLALTGLLLIFFISDGSMTLPGLILVLCGALAWAFANAVAKKSGVSEPFALMIWSSLVSPLPLLLIALYFNGTNQILLSLRQVDSTVIASILFQVFPTTLFGYSIWNSLIRKYPMSVVAPITFLVPIFGMAGSVVLFSETLPAYKTAAIVLIVAGLLVNRYGQAAWKTVHARTVN